ncbi:hypothetical protein E4U55_000584 [Claviceps digitariae]|nr:hypothetical protein E4U55_000584 [Claviceps digitariae]
MTTPDSNPLLSSSPAHTAGESTSSGAQISSHTDDGAAINSVPRLRPPRSLPPWIDSYERRYGPVSEEQLRLLQPPARIVQRQSNVAPNDAERRVSRDGFIGFDDPKLGPARKARSRIPHFLRYGRASMRGRKWDHLRSSEPVIVSKYRPAPSQGAMSWQDFVHSSSWGRMMNVESEVVDYETLNKLQPTFNSGIKVQFHHSDGRVKDKDSRKAVFLPRRIWNAIMRHPLSPLLFRLGVMVTSILALGLSARIYQLEDGLNKNSAERTQSLVAVVVDCVAIPYIGYMTWDEFTGKPLGLRSAMSKISLILLDLFFIIFKSASTALAFETFIYHGARHSSLNNLSMALAAFQLLGLISWSMTFTVNVFRMVKRMGGGRGGGDDNDDFNV